jgi:hypothetical protein
LRIDGIGLDDLAAQRLGAGEVAHLVAMLGACSAPIVGEPLCKDDQTGSKKSDSPTGDSSLSVEILAASFDLQNTLTTRLRRIRDNATLH